MLLNCRRNRCVLRYRIYCCIVVDVTNATLRLACGFAGELPGSTKVVVARYALRRSFLGLGL